MAHSMGLVKKWPFLPIFGHFCPFLDKLEVTPPLLASVTWPSFAQIKSTACWGKFGTQLGPIGAPFLGALGHRKGAPIGPG